MRGRNGTTHDYYRCRRYDPVRVGDPAAVCTQRNIRARELDAFVWREAYRHLGDPATLARAYAALSTDGGGLDDDVSTARAQALDRRQRDLGQETTRLLDAYQAGLIDLPQFARRQTLLREKRDRLAREHRLLMEQQTAADWQQTICASLEGFSQQIRGRLQNLTFKEKQQVLRLVIEKVMVRDHQVSIHFKIPIQPRPRPVPETPGQAAPTEPVSTQCDLRSTHGHPRRELSAQGAEEGRAPAGDRPECGTEPADACAARRPGGEEVRPNTWRVGNFQPPLWGDFSRP